MPWSRLGAVWRARRDLYGSQRWNSLGLPDWACFSIVLYCIYMLLRKIQVDFLLKPLRLLSSLRLLASLEYHGVAISHCLDACLHHLQTKPNHLLVRTMCWTEWSRQMMEKQVGTYGCWTNNLENTKTNHQKKTNTTKQHINTHKTNNNKMETLTKT